MKHRIIDLSHPINTATPPWPGWPSVETKFLDRASRTTPEERHVNSSRFAMNIHCGTHMDAPYHFLDTGKTIDQVPLERTYGPATLVDLRGKGSRSHITRADLVPCGPDLRRTRKAILHTGWAARWMKHGFFTEFPDITTDAAQFLVECGVELVGVETGSVDFHPNDTHIVLLGNDVLIIECLVNLDQIPTLEFLFSATPLNIEGCDGSPVRAMAIVNS
ncbi:MAG: cyclase family protein [Pedosphaera sp.]|nr:cyclase family protein [Pedosphaera sp.]